MKQQCFTSQKIKRNMPTAFKGIKGCWEGGYNLLFVYVVGGARSNGFKLHKEIPPEVCLSPFCLGLYITINFLSYIKCSCKWSLLSDKCEKLRKLIKKTQNTPPPKRPWNKQKKPQRPPKQPILSRCGKDKYVEVRFANIFFMTGSK